MDLENSTSAMTQSSTKKAQRLTKIQFWRLAIVDSELEFDSYYLEFISGFFKPEIYIPVLIASTGSNREALNAGTTPEINPIIDEIKKPRPMF